MSRCGNGASCGCVLVEGDNITIEGSGSPNDPYIIFAEGFDPDTFGGILTVNGISGPNAQVGAYDVGAVAPYGLKLISTSSTTIAVEDTVVTVSAATGNKAVSLPTITSDMAARGQRIRVTKARTDTTANTVTVSTSGGNTFHEGETSVVLKLTGESMEMQAGLIGSTRLWKILGQTVPRSVEETYFAQVTNIERSVNFTISTATQSEPLGNNASASRLGSINMQFQTALAQSDTIYWTAQVYRYRNGEIPQLVGTKTTRVTGGTAISAYLGWDFDTLIGPSVLKYMRKGDGLMVTFTPTGAAAALGKAVVNVRYEPGQLAPVRDSFTRGDSTSSLGSTEDGTAWTTHAGTWGIKSNAAYVSALASDTVSATRVFASVPVPAADGSTTAKLLVTPANAGIAVRMVKNASTTTSGFTHDGTNAYRVDNSVLTSVGTFSTAFAAGDTITWVTAGSTHTIYRNGAVVLTFTDAAYASNARVGMRMANAGVVGVSALDDLAWAA